ncbi:MAG TPA: hypothetical protein VNJ02_12365 [Vicinamibacterales bacterium]|nr:hypothetical protein [Vicinamibacterales bacterium]
MKALYTNGGHVRLARVLREYRTALLPLAIVLAINIALLIVVVLPLSRSVEANEQRAVRAEREQAAAELEFKQAEDLREGQARATTDLETFYQNVLPADAAAARRIMRLKLQQKAREYNVQFERAATTDEPIDDSVLERQVVVTNLSGNWQDIRGFIYALETSPDFLIIDNVVIAEGTVGGALSLSLELSTYYRSPPSAEIRTGRDGR